MVDYINDQQFHYHFPIITLIVLYQLILYTTLIKMTLLSLKEMMRVGKDAFFIQV